MSNNVNYGFDNLPEIVSANAHREDTFKLPELPEEVEHLSDEEKQKEKRTLYLSMIGLCLCITGVSSAFNALFNSQTSLLPNDNLGNTSITIGSGMTIVSSAILTSYFVQIGGIKKVMTLAMFFLTLYFAAYFYPKLVLIAIASAQSGIAFSCIITTIYAYGNSAVHWYHKLFGGNLSLMLTLVSSIVNMFFNGGFLWGNILLYFILNDETQDTSHINSTVTNVSICGANFCNEDLYTSTNNERPSDQKYYTLIGVFTFISLSGTVGTLFLTDIPKKLHGSQSKTPGQFWKVLLESWHVLKQPKGFLPSFLFLFIGMEQAFTASVFTQAFITCNFGVSKVGFIMFTYGISEIIMSGAQWILIKTVGRPVLIIFIYMIFMGCYIYLILSMVFETLPYFIIATLFGLGDATLLSTSFALYGYLFPEHTEGAFSLITLWMGVGTFIPLLTNQYLCVSVKLYILIGFGTFAFSAYLVLEAVLYMQMRKKRSK